MPDADRDPFFPHKIILGYIFRSPLGLCSQRMEEVWLTASIPTWAFTNWPSSGGTDQNLIPQGKLPAPIKPCKNCRNGALTVPGHLASLLLSRSSSVVCKSLNPSSAHGEEQTQQHQPKDWQLWFMLKCFLLGQIVSTEKMQVASSDKKALFSPFFLSSYFFFLPHFWYVLPVVGTVSLISPCSLSLLEIYL